MTDYERLMADTWRAIQAPREPGAPTVISTFAGGGGSSMGYKMSGYDVRVAVEWMKYPAACYRHNFHTTKVIEGDIAEVSVDALLELSNLKPGELDVFDGSPPCQGFSTSGKRQMTDPRNSLFKEYVRLVQGLRPRVFVMENVSGMIKGPMLWVFGQILAALKGCGYSVVCKLLNAADYGVPQNRRRVIFIGVREDLALTPTHPESSVLKHTTIKDVLDNPKYMYFVPGRFSANPQASFLNTFKAFRGDDAIRTIIKTPTKLLTSPTSGHLSQELPAPILKGKVLELARRLIAGASASSLTPDGSWGATVRLAPNKLCPTVTKQGSIFGAVKLIHPIELRGLSIGEVKRLSSFPDAYEFLPFGSATKTWENAWGILGNSVPPLLCGAVAKHIRNTVLAPLGFASPI